jgi:hypothetical protein
MYGFYKTPSTFQVLALPFTIVETKKHAIRRQTQRYVIVQLQEKAIITKKRGHGNGVPRLSTFLLSMAQK